MSSILKLSVVACLFCYCFSARAQSFRRVVVSPSDSLSGYYLAMEPSGYSAGDSLAGVMVLLSGFSQRAEHIYTETRLPNVAYANNILTVCFAAGFKMYADSTVQRQLSDVLRDVVNRYKVRRNHFALGGFSAGGNIVLRYTELCHQYPERFPVSPRGVFLVDAPIDVFTLWDMLDEARAENFSPAAVQEAEAAMHIMRNQFGTPRENVAAYAAVNPFSMNKAYGDNEKFLRHTAVRAYHDVDIPWRLVNRRQTVRHGNYYVTSELIYRLLRMGNAEAEFIQSDRKGYRSNGQRHPHSWSIVEEMECVQWMSRLFGRK